MSDSKACPACGRGNTQTARFCGSCGVLMVEGGMELDPLLREMWLAHARSLPIIKNTITVIGWVVVVFAALSLLGGYLWYQAAENGTLGGFS